MLTVPLQAVPAQNVRCVLGNQMCQINLKQRRPGLFMDLYVADQPLVVGVLCQNLNFIVRSAYFRFIGDFVFYDTHTAAGGMGVDPDYTGLAGRFLLFYIEESDFEAAIAAQAA